VGTGGFVFPFPAPGHLQKNRQDAGRKASGAGALHCRRGGPLAPGAGSHGYPQRQGLRPSQAHLFHLEQDAQKGGGFFRGVRRPGRAGHRG